MRLLMLGALLTMITGCDELLDDNSEPYVGDTLELCDADMPDDEVWIADASLSGDILSLDVGYGGGCEAHQLRLCWDGGIMESYPMQARIWVSHNANGDSCEAALNQLMEVDISSLDATPTYLLLEGWEGELLYE